MANFTNASSTSKASQARETILGWIKEGKYKHGDRLPPERELAKTMGLNHLTVRRGLDDLVKQGIIVKQPSVGNFVEAVQSAPMTTHLAVVFPHYMLDEDNESAIRQISRMGEQGYPFPSFVHHPLPGIFLNAIHKELSWKKYQVSTFFYRDSMFCKDMEDAIVHRGIKGIVFFGSFYLTYENLKALVDTGVKIVIVGRARNATKELGLLSIRFDDDLPLLQTLNHFYELGHRRITVIRYVSTQLPPETDEVIPEFVRKTGLSESEFSLLNVKSTEGKTVDFGAVRTFFDRSPMSTAVVVPDEFIANVFFRECYLRGVMVPRDVSVAALHDIAPHVHPVPLSAPDSIQTHVRTAELAFQNLLRMINGESLSEQQITLRCDMVWKESVGPVPESRKNR